MIDMLFHNPVVLAKRFATLDLLSGGRAIAGLGIGWSKDEFWASNISMEKRGRRADEFIQLLKTQSGQTKLQNFMGSFITSLHQKLDQSQCKNPLYQSILVDQVQILFPGWPNMPMDG